MYLLVTKWRGVTAEECMPSHESAAQLRLVTAHLSMLKGLGLKVVLLGNDASLKRRIRPQGSHGFVQMVRDALDSL